MMKYAEKSGPFCLVDLETTGLSAAREEITEIAVIRVDERLETLAEMSWLVRIERSVTWRITELTGITDHLLRTQGKPLTAVLPELRAFVGGLPTYAHNAMFDRNFLEAAVSRTAMPLGFSLECSMPIFKQLMPGRRGYGLPVLAEDLEVDATGAHRALADCRTLLGCLQKAYEGAQSVK